jgi:hypothetical protein
MTDDSMIPLRDGPEEAALRARLQAAAPSAALAADRAEALRARIMASAAARLALRSAPVAPSWLDVAARWSRIAIPTSALAAGIGLIAALSAARTNSANVTAAVATTARAADAPVDSATATTLRSAMWKNGSGSVDAAELVARANGMTVSESGLVAASEAK